MKKLFLLPFVFVLGSCLSSGPAVDASRSARTDLNWEGVYSGLIPAASGPGIEVRITLNRDQTFELQYEYIDRADSIFTCTGTFEWDDTEDIIKLDSEEYPPYYLVAENKLIQLDLQGNMITGSLAENYVLGKNQ